MVNHNQSTAIDLGFLAICNLGHLLRRQMLLRSRRLLVLLRRSRRRSRKNPRSQRQLLNRKHSKIKPKRHKKTHLAVVAMKKLLISYPRRTLSR
jgi:hypothetical protein